MRFGRVEGVVVPVEQDGRSLLRLTVYLETGSRLEIVRDDLIAPLRPLQSPADVAWHADQFTQETIGTDLAAQGWEAIGAGDLPEPETEPGALIRSAAYAVRNVG